MRSGPGRGLLIDRIFDPCEQVVIDGRGGTWGGRRRKRTGRPRNDRFGRHVVCAGVERTPPAECPRERSGRPEAGRAAGKRDRDDVTRVSGNVRVDQIGFPGRIGLDRSGLLAGQHFEGDGRQSPNIGFQGERDVVGVCFGSLHGSDRYAESEQFGGPWASTMTSPGERRPWTNPR